MTELLPCPFCGGEAQLERKDTGIQAWSCHCGNPDCYAGAVDVVHPNRDALIEAWNKRHEPTWGDFTKVAKGVKVAYLDAPERTCHNLKQDGYNYLECSECGEKSYQGDKVFNYCPICGAVVRE